MAYGLNPLPPTLLFFNYRSFAFSGRRNDFRLKSNKPNTPQKTCSLNQSLVFPFAEESHRTSPPPPNPPSPPKYTQLAHALLGEIFSLRIWVANAFAITSSRLTNCSSSTSSECSYGSLTIPVSTLTQGLSPPPPNNFFSFSAWPTFDVECTSGERLSVHAPSSYGELENFSYFLTLATTPVSLTPFIQQILETFILL